MAILATLSALQLALVVFLLWDRRTERREHARQVADLCQRIQAPASAVAIHEQAQLPPSPPAIGPDDDARWHEEHPTSREAMVKWLEAADR